MSQRCAVCGRALVAGRCAERHGADSLEAFTVPRPRVAHEADAPTQLTDEPTRLTADPLLPEVIGGFRLDFVLGTGGMGAVWRAHDEALGTPVALKVLKHEAQADPVALERSFREAQAAARIQHPSVAPLLGHGRLDDGRPWLATPLYEGRSLSELLLERGPLPWALAVPVLGELAGALEAAHAAGVVHRDVKPANVFLARNGDGSVTLKLLDFGLALVGEAGAPVPQTGVQSVAGTAEFIAPEQALGRSLDARTDLYALGVTAFQLLSGRLPFHAETTTQVLRLHLTQPAPALPRELELPRGLAALVEKLLQKRPAERPQTGAEVRAALMTLALPTPGGDGLLEQLARQWSPAPRRWSLARWWRDR